MWCLDSEKDRQKNQYFVQAATSSVPGALVAWCERVKISTSLESPDISWLFVTRLFSKKDEDRGDDGSNPAPNGHFHLVKTLRAMRDFADPRARLFTRYASITVFSSFCTTLPLPSTLLSKNHPWSLRRYGDRLSYSDCNKENCSL